MLTLMNYNIKEKFCCNNNIKPINYLRPIGQAVIFAA